MAEQIEDTLVIERDSYRVELDRGSGAITGLYTLGSASNWVANTPAARFGVPFFNGTQDQESLLALHPLSTYLFELLRKWNFPRELVPEIISSLEASPGKKFYSSSHRLVKDRDHLIVTPLPAETVNRYYVEEYVEKLDHPLKVRFTRIKHCSGFKIPENRKTACLDLDLLYFPLIIRKWQKGDYFQPLGLNGLKKLSDFFIDNKLSLVEKEKVWLLTSNNRIAWIMGHRIDDRFKITERTKEILMIELGD